jgi:hypothetical protein
VLKISKSPSASARPISKPSAPVNTSIGSGQATQRPGNPKGAKDGPSSASHFVLEGIQQPQMDAPSTCRKRVNRDPHSFDPAAARTKRVTGTSLSASQTASSASIRNNRAAQVAIPAGATLNLQSLSTFQTVTGCYLADGVPTPGPLLDVLDVANEPLRKLNLYLCLFKNDPEPKFLTSERVNSMNLGSAFLRWWDDFLSLDTAPKRTALHTCSRRPP